MAKKTQHVVPMGNGWAVHAEARKTVSVITTRQSEAISYAKDIAVKERVGVVIHGKDDKVRKIISYAQLPCAVLDK